jgi:DNA repair protein RadC
MCGQQRIASPLVYSATSILVAHNPSKSSTPDIRPSAEDVAVTRRLCEAGKLLEIPVVDHLSVSQDGFYSFLEHGQIPSRRT